MTPSGRGAGVVSGPPPFFTFDRCRVALIDHRDGPGRRWAPHDWGSQHHPLDVRPCSMEEAPASVVPRQLECLRSTCRHHCTGLLPFFLRTRHVLDRLLVESTMDEESFQLGQQVPHRVEWDGGPRGGVGLPVDFFPFPAFRF